MSNVDDEGEGVLI